MNEKKLHIHFIGVGGSGMSGLASIFLDLGHKISGSDIVTSKITKRLADKGATIFTGHNKDNVEGADLIVVSSAIPESNSEISGARDRNITIIKRAEMLARLMENKYGIAIAGTHGKSTTASMISLLLEKSGFDPTVVVGGELNNFKNNAKLGKGNHIVVEADESDGSFLELSPHIAIVTNIEDDHLDHYENMENILKDFGKFIEKVPDNGRIILCKDCDNVKELVKQYRRSHVSYGIFTEADLMAKDIELNNLNSKSKIYWQGEKIGELYLKVAGYHNILNALAAIAVGLELGISFREIAKILETFQGVHRRMEIVGSTDNNILIIDDYAHHPTEIKATLSSLRSSWQNRRIIAVFQPHRYSRTKLLAEKFGKAFFDADCVIVNDIYSANELPISGISGETIFREIKKNYHRQIKYLPSKDNILSYLYEMIQPGDIIITMGAGDIWTVGQELAKQLNENKGILI
ncbi:MAG: UDP-N-acetylmuramate--L-alanine ligase [Candidatus Atribacteria bacterium]|nr:UDP-N-acetylmuramate--L-alanine ligase [Candidatus Atribacteria bacterium]